MVLFDALPKTQENFFPNITEEYRNMLRSNFLRWKWDAADLGRVGYCEEDPFDSQQPHYKTFPFKPTRRIKTGDTVSVLSFFLSARVPYFVKSVCSDGAANANGADTRQLVHVGVEQSLRDKKYVLVLCVFVPMRWSQADIDQLSRLSLASSELLSSQPDFEFVLVVKMRKNDTTNEDYDESTFTHFLSTAFPGRLAVPYSSSEARDLLCQKLHFDGQLKGILVDNDKRHPNRRVLMSDVYFFVRKFATHGFPLTYEKLNSPYLFTDSDVSLAWLLRCDPSHNLNNMLGSTSMSIDQLSKKVVGLYLCQRGDRLASLHDVYHQCRVKSLEFEVIFVCMPLLDCIDPIVFQDEVYAFARDLELDISSWWVFPYHTSTCIRLWHLAEIEHSDTDAMVILGPNSTYADSFAGQISHYFGVAAYPFTRRTAAGIYADKAGEVTLSSLLNGEHVDYLVEPSGRRVPLTYLCQKNVLLYVDCPTWSMKTCEMFREWYDTFKKCRARSSFELVLVSNTRETHPLMKSPPRGVTPLHYFSDSKHWEFLQGHAAFFKGLGVNKVYTGLDIPTVISFRKDGHINMLNALDYLIRHGYEDPFDPECLNTGLEVIHMMSEAFDFMIEYETEAT